jgi:DNA repair exonuclease SbcCD ATPase subunit
MIDIQTFRTQLERKKGIVERIETEYMEVDHFHQRTLSELEDAEEAQIAIKEIAKQTQAELEYHISDGVSHGLASILRSPYTFRLSFVCRRDKTEADLFWEKNGKQYEPHGGGVRDISSFALRIIMKCIQIKAGCSTLFLDEPWKCLKPLERQRKALLLMKEIASALKLQIIMVTSAESDKDVELIKTTDTCYEIIKDETEVSRTYKLN